MGRKLEPGNLSIQMFNILIPLLHLTSERKEQDRGSLRGVAGSPLGFSLERLSFSGCHMPRKPSMGCFVFPERQRLGQIWKIFLSKENRLHSCFSSSFTHQRYRKGRSERSGEGAKGGSELPPSSPVHGSCWWIFHFCLFKSHANILLFLPSNASRRLCKCLWAATDCLRALFLVPRGDFQSELKCLKYGGLLNNNSFTTVIAPEEGSTQGWS